MALLFALAVRATTSRPDSGGGRHHLAMGYNLWKHGTLTHSSADRPDVAPSWRREPLYPVLLAGALALSADPAVTSYRCLIGSEPACAPLVRRIKLLNAALFAALCGCTLAAARAVLPGGPAPWLAFGLVALDGALWSALDRFKAEPLAALEIVAASLFLHRMATRPAPLRWALAAGLALGALILTKAVFFYVGPLLLAAGGLFAWRARRPRVAAPFAAAVAVAYLVAGVWVARNVSLGAGVRISEDRSVLSIRAEHATMRWGEWAAAWLYYVQEQHGVGRGLLHRLFAPSEWERLDIDNPQGFLRLAKEARGAVAARTGVEKPSAAQMYQAAKRVILEHWPMHVALTGPFAVRGLFLGESLFEWRPARVATIWAANALIPALCVASAWFALRRRWDACLLLLLPLYCYAFHSFATHNNVKYGWPLIPSGALAAALLADAFLRRARAALRSAGPRA